MFGKRSGGADRLTLPTRTASPPVKAPSEPASAPAQAPVRQTNVEPDPVQRSPEYYSVKSAIFAALVEVLEVSKIAALEPAVAREEIRDVVGEIIAIKNVVLSMTEQEDLLEDICNDMLGLGPLEPLLMRDDIADIMVNGATRTYIEVGGKIQLTNIRFRDAARHRRPGADHS